MLSHISKKAKPALPSICHKRAYQPLRRLRHVGFCEFVLACGIISNDIKPSIKISILRVLLQKIARRLDEFVLLGFGDAQQRIAKP